jgi:hypothetical protein
VTPTTRHAAVLCAALLLTACRDGVTPTVGPLPIDAAAAKGGNPPNTQRVVVSPATAALDIGETVQLTAAAYARKNTVIPGATFTWASSAPSVASVSSNGLVTGVNPGTAAITATHDGKSGTSTITVSAPPDPGDVVLVAAGDIAQCGSSNDEATAALVDNIAGTVAVLGDNAYENGTATEYSNCYGPSWGRHLARTMPSAGNHEYGTGSASGYFNYFGAVSAPTGGYYSYDLGAWHVIVLNSNCGFVPCGTGSAQLSWLQNDLAATTRPCVLAYWHHPRFNSGASHGNNTNVAPFWDALYAAGAEVVLNGHEHLYERFAPQTPGAQLDLEGGIRQFTVGTGGRGLYSIGTIKANSEVRNNSTFGVLQLTLGAGTYSWQFVPIAGQTFTDSGSGTCH